MDATNNTVTTASAAVIASLASAPATTANTGNQVMINHISHATSSFAAHAVAAPVTISSALVNVVPYTTNAALVDAAPAVMSTSIAIVPFNSNRTVYSYSSIPSEPIVRNFVTPTPTPFVASAHAANVAGSCVTDETQVRVLYEQIRALETQLSSAKEKMNNTFASNQTIDVFGNTYRAPVTSTSTPTSTATSAALHSIPFSFSNMPASFQLPRDSPIATSIDSNRTPFSATLTSTSGFLPNYQTNYSQQLTNEMHSMPHNLASTYSFVPRKIEDLPQFSGVPEDWPLFENAFIQSTAAYNYNDFENNQRLQKCLKGEAREVVKSLLIHPSNVGAVIEQLRFRFGRPELLIRSQLKHVKDISPIPDNAIEKLIPFSTKVKNLAIFLQSVNGVQHISNPTLLDELLSKLSMNKRLEWARYAAAIKPYPTILDFSCWLSEVANLVCLVQENENRRRVVLHTSGSSSEPRYQCLICQGPHKILECNKFLELDVAERWTKVKNLHLCFSCLKVGHSTRNCRQRIRCPMKNCNKSHHKLLHVDFKTNDAGPSNQTSDVAKGAVLSCSNERQDDGLLFRVLPVTLYGPCKQIDTFALMDEGSSVTIMDKDIMDDLGLEGEQRDLGLPWLDGKTVHESSSIVNLHVSGLGLQKRHKLHNVYAVSKLTLPMQSLQAKDLLGLPDNLKKFVKPLSNATPKILIGLDHCHLGMPSETMKIREGGPYACNTELGWVVFGPVAKHSSVPRCLFVRSVRDDNLHNLVQDYFSTESFGVRPSPPICSEDDKRALSILEKNTIRVTGRFQSGLLWKADDIKLPDSFSMALKRLIGIERKMKKDEVFAAAYNSIIDSYIGKNYARKLSPSEVTMKSQKIWYLPHFGVFNPNKPGKLRLVFDAAAEVNGTSLNSCLLKGPQEYLPLPSVLFNFRKGAIAVCGDIKEMFHQILIQPSDRLAQRFLWRNGEGHRPPDIYEMQVMTFGAACSPCTAQYVKCRNAVEFSSKYPRAVEAITKHHYVDDFVDSFVSVEEALNITKQVVQIHKCAGYELRQFKSNSPDIVKALEGNKFMEGDSHSRFGENIATSEKVLGLYWNSIDDTFKYELKFCRVEAEVIAGCKRPSKRVLLSIIMSIFDPLGFVSHFVIAGKLLMREVWRRNLTWDEPLPDDINLCWMKWRENIKKATEAEIPRYYFHMGGLKQPQLHIFVDASEEAFAAVAYWRYFKTNDEIGTAFICAKTKCAPLKPMSVPRLELQAAVLGTRLMQTVKEEHALETSDCVLWSDSSTVIKWLSAEHRRYKPFVAHRVAEILAATNISNWKWIPTRENVADEATRWNTEVNFCNQSRWFSGPKFLLESSEMWPKGPNICNNGEEHDEELQTKFVMFTACSQVFDFSRFSMFKRLIRTVAWVKRFINRIQKKNFPESEYGLSKAEIEEAEALIYRQVQKDNYAEEIQLVESGLNIFKESSLYKMVPFLDDAKVLRVGGRIEAASWLAYTIRHPIILPPKHQVTTLILEHYHRLMKHQNTEATICEIRRKFWVPKLRTIMRSIVANCCVCKLSRAVPVNPIMGPLPEDRLTPFIRPFTYTGIDYFGPLNVTIGRRHEKRWVALFTCLTVRAIHLEVAYDLSTDSCILAIRNFINRRGVPVRIRSDNGTNFIGARQEAKKFSEIFDCGIINDELTSRGIEWILNCPNNPSEGGIWERMVQCVKKVLRQTLKEVAPREHTLHSFLIEAENIVNSRPLTHLPVTIDQEEPLTPNHFLLGSANTLQTPCVDDVHEQTLALRKQWRIARQMRDHFWKRWIAEYLPTLTRRAKWCEKTSPLKKGDLVFICDGNVSRRLWGRGIVENVYSGADGHIRKADVKTSTGVLRRPVSKLAVLDVESGEAESLHGRVDVEN